jgi:hypothetical protein
MREWQRSTCRPHSRATGQRLATKLDA